MSEHRDQATTSPMVTLDIGFIRAAHVCTAPHDCTAALVCLDEEGNEGTHATLRERDLSSLQASASTADLPWRVTAATHPGRTWLLRGMTTGRVLQRIEAQGTPAVQVHRFDRVDHLIPDDTRCTEREPCDWGVCEDDLPAVHEVSLEAPAPSIAIGPLLDGAFDATVEARYDAAMAAAVSTGLLRESDVDSLTDALSVVPEVRRDSAMLAQLASLWARQEASASRLLLTALPNEVLTALLIQAASASELAPTRGIASRPSHCAAAKVLSRCAAACRVLYHCADEAARGLAAAQSLDLSIARCPARVLLQPRHAVRALHACLTDLPYPVAPRPPTVARLAQLLAPFAPRLCVGPALALPRYVGDVIVRGEAEFVNFAAIMQAWGAASRQGAEGRTGPSGGPPTGPSLPTGLAKMWAASQRAAVETLLDPSATARHRAAAQQLIEAAWAEGIDEMAADDFPDGIDAPVPIGSTELLAALLHLRIDADIIEVHAGVGGGRALIETAARCFDQREIGGTALPILLQERGHSRLILGATTACGREALLIADPRQPGEVAAAPLDALTAKELTSDFSLLLIRGDGTRTISAAAARRRGGVPFAACSRILPAEEAGVEPRPTIGVRRWFQGDDEEGADELDLAFDG